MSDGESNGGSWTDVSSLVVAIIALIVSVVALVGMIVQLLQQQYMATAVGYNNCRQRVMGPWGKYTRLMFRPSELRFEVIFQTPVIFVTSPGNRRGPVYDTEIHFIDGTASSEGATDVPAGHSRREAKTGKLITTSYLASWLTMLSTVQAMERDSREWQQSTETHYHPLGEHYRHFEGSRPSYSLAVAIQRGKQSLDMMPEGVKRPYATTTLGHVVEIAAMLGMHWKSFDRNNDRYIAEGNGSLLIGTSVPHLGVTFTFTRDGIQRFNSGRVIPSDDCKELCFGWVPTIFRSADDRQYGEKNTRSLRALRLGSNSEIAESLMLIGCDRRTARYFQNSNAVTEHIFPFVFEIMGMTARTVHIEDTLFRRLPNPTPYRWEKWSFSFQDLLEEFRDRVLQNKLVEMTDKIHSILQRVEGILQRLSESPDTGRADGTQGQFSDIDPEITPRSMKALHNTLDYLDGYLRDEVPQEAVRQVLRTHFETVLELMNSPGSGEVESQAARQKVDEFQFEDLSYVPFEARPIVLWENYFGKVLPRVISSMGFQQRGQTWSTAISGQQKRQDSGLGSISASIPVSVDLEGPGKVSPNMVRNNLLVTDVWVTLVFRMLCWLQLHDFDQKDVQILSSDLLGSRLPVYIN